MEKILISACLIGDKVKFDGGSNYNPLYKELSVKYDLVPFCPEVEGGLSIPRKPSERRGEKVINDAGKDVTQFFQAGAKKALAICQYLGIKIAILKERSPSCGSKQIHDGTFSNRLIKGEGVTTELLRRNGIRVISEEELEAFLEEIK